MKETLLVLLLRRELHTVSPDSFLEILNTIDIAVEQVEDASTRLRLERCRNIVARIAIRRFTDRVNKKVSLKSP